MEKTVYIDSRGWRYLVVGGNYGFKPFYRKPDKTEYHPCRQFDWRSSFYESKIDLNEYAAAHGWEKL